MRPLIYIRENQNWDKKIQPPQKKKKKKGENTKPYHCCAQEAQDLFHHHSVIWVPKKEGVESSHQQTAGRMLGRDEVWWQDTSGLFLKYRASLLEFHLPLADRHPVEHLYR